MKFQSRLVLALLSCFQMAIASECPPGMLRRCSCGNASFEGSIKFLVNCTNTGFTKGDMLQYIPIQTEVRM